MRASASRLAVEIEEARGPVARTLAQRFEGVERRLVRIEIGVCLLIGMLALKGHDIAQLAAAFKQVTEALK